MRHVIFTKKCFLFNLDENTVVFRNKLGVFNNVSTVCGSVISASTVPFSKRNNSPFRIVIIVLRVEKILLSNFRLTEMYFNAYERKFY